MNPTDRDAYRRLRAKGYQPDHIEGCAAIEADATRESLTWGKNLTDEQIAEQRQAMLEAQL